MRGRQPRDAAEDRQGFAGFATPRPVVERHRYRVEIEDLLAAGWAPRTLNVLLGRLHSDYVPAAERTLRWHREHRLPKTRLRPVEAYERMLRDDQVLLDTVREKAALVALQKARLSRALALEEQMAGVVLPQIGYELDRLIKLLEAYERSVEMVGLLPKALPAETVAAPSTVNVIELVRAEMSYLPPEPREQLERLLHQARYARIEAEIAPIEARVRNVPAPIYDDGDPDPAKTQLESEEESDD